MDSNRNNATVPREHIIPIQVNGSNDGGGQHPPQDARDNKPLQEGYGSPPGPGYHPPPPGAYPPGPQGAAPYPTPPGAYPSPQPPQGGYPLSQPAQGYPSPQPPPGAYAPQGGYMPPQQGYPQPGYGPPAQGGYPTPPQGGQIAPYAPGPPITNQPMGHGAGMMPPTNEWMHMPQGIPNCPPGLEYLTMIDHLMVHQKVELIEAITGYETENKYSVHNSLGQKVYNAIEISDGRMRSWAGSFRPFEIKIIDNFGHQIINLKRPLACKWCCFPCCLQTMEVCAPVGNVIGLIEQQWSFLYPKFLIKSPAGDEILRIEGPMITMSCCSDVDFKVMTVDGTNQVGKISKQWAGYAKEAYTVADNFGISFPMDLDVRMKAVMLGACFLIDMMYYEDSSSSSSSSNKNTGQQQQPQQMQQPQQPARPV